MPALAPVTRAVGRGVRCAVMRLTRGTGRRRGRLSWATVRIATWNVNSIRSRIDRVAAWLERSDVDVLAIQETKAREEQFPLDRFTALGYEVAHHGLNQWNGVAVISRVGLDRKSTRLNSSHTI